jgi:hypothetical protein
MASHARTFYAQILAGHANARFRKFCAPILQAQFAAFSWAKTMKKN